MNLLFMFLQLIEGTRKLHWDFPRTDSIRFRENFSGYHSQAFHGVSLQSIPTPRNKWGKGLCGTSTKLTAL